MDQIQVADESCRIVVGSGKGGVGKSILSVMLAAAAAERGREVLLVDGEQNLGNLHVLLGLGARGSIESGLGGRTRAQDLVQPVVENLWLLPAESGAEGLYALDALKRARLHWRLVELLATPMKTCAAETIREGRLDALDLAQPGRSRP